MHFDRNIIYFICIIFLLISCSNNEDVPALQAPTSAAFSVTTDGPSKIVVGESSVKFGIYATIYGNTAKPDTLSIYKSFDNCPYSITWNQPPNENTGILSADFVNKTIVFPYIGTLHFYGYSPYVENSDLAGWATSPLFKVNDWNKQETPYLLDLLVAKDVVATAGLTPETTPSVNLDFYHKFCKITLNVSVDSEKTSLIDADLEGMTVSASGMNYETTCNIRTGEVKSIAQDLGSFNFKKNATGNIYEAIVCPEVIPNSSSKITFALNNDMVFEWSVPEVKETKTFESGKNYIWNIRLKGNDLVEAELVGVFHDWSDGGKSTLVLGENGVVSPSANMFNRLKLQKSPVNRLVNNRQSAEFTLQYLSGESAGSFTNNRSLFNNNYNTSFVLKDGTPIESKEEGNFLVWDFEDYVKITVNDNVKDYILEFQP